LEDRFAPAFLTLHTFTNTGDGSHPHAGLVLDGNGNLYGTTYDGTIYNFGTVFELSPAGTLTTLHVFTDNDGHLPDADLIRDGSGNLYGTTTFGVLGFSSRVFQLSPSGTYSIPYFFRGGNDGYAPAGALVRDNSGNLYGTTIYGGTHFAGAVFQIRPGGVETTLYSFTGGSDGFEPYAGLVMDGSGNLFGTTARGGSGYGTVFEISAGGTFTSLYRFTGLGDGGVPLAGLIMDSSGNLYGTTSEGGSNGATSDGTVFRLSPSGVLTTLHGFSGGDGAKPVAGLVMDSGGNLYGTTSGGGVSNDGTVFQLSPSGAFTSLHSFSQTDGSVPLGDLTIDRSGNLYGTTENGGPTFYNDGTVFELPGAVVGAAPVVTPSTANLSATATSLTIIGSGFSSTPTNDTVAFDNGVTGATATSLTVRLSGLGGLTAGTALHASVTVNGVSSGSTVQVATTVLAVTSSTVQAGQSAGIGFWANKNGQALIDSFNGGGSSTALANWLAASFPNLYGANAGASNLTGKSNDQVAAFYEGLSGESGPKLDTQVLGTALNVYATTQSLGGAAAAACGFTVTADGLGAAWQNVGSGGAAFGVADNTALNVYQILQAVNRQAGNGVLYNGDSALDGEAVDVFNSINGAGGL
jgi:uncharacterized repeat protein (TIGR03803 family)